MRLSRSREPSRLAFQPGAELTRSAFVLDLDRNREAARPADARASGELGAPEPSPRREQRQGFEEISLARAVLAAKHDQRALERQIERRVGAEVPEHQPAHHRAAARAGEIGRARHGLAMCHVRPRREGEARGARGAVSIGPEPLTRRGVGSRARSRQPALGAKARPLAGLPGPPSCRMAPRTETTGRRAAWRRSKC